MAGRTTFLTALLLLGVLAISSAQEQVESIAESIDAFIEAIDDGATGRDLKAACSTCGVSTARPPSPPPPYPPPPVTILCPPPPPPVRVSLPCPSCHRASPPPRVTIPVKHCPPPPVRVSTPSPCHKCHRASPPPVRVTTPTKHCPPPPVAVVHPSPVAVPHPSPVRAPPKRGPWCGRVRKWVSTTNRWGRKRWTRRTVDTYCKAGEKCCKIPSSWGNKSWGPKRSKKSKSQLKCYKKCPNCWY